MPMKLKTGKSYVLANDLVVKMIGMSYEKPTMHVGVDDSNLCYLFFDYGNHYFDETLDVVAEWEKNDEDAVGN